MSGKLKIMNLLPKTISKLILYFLSAFKPTINIDTILLYILKYDFKSKDVNLKNHQLNILSENIYKNLFFLFSKEHLIWFLTIYYHIFMVVIYFNMASNHTRNSWSRLFFKKSW